MTERRNSRIIVRCSFLFLLIGLILPTHAKSQTITEFYIFPNSAPTSITAGSDGNLWFAETFGNRIGRITPSGVITRFYTGITPDSGPVGIAAGPGATSGLRRTPATG